MARMNNRLFYTLQMVLADLKELINDPNINPVIVNWYDTINTMYENEEFEIYIDDNTTPDIIADYIVEEYNIIMDVYIDDLIIEAETYANKKKT